MDNRTEEARIAARIFRSIGGLTEDDADLIIAYGQELKAMIASTGAVDAPLLPELSSARPAEAHIVLLTEIERTFTETIFRLNQIPNKVRIALLRLLGIELRTAQAATCTLQFTKTADFLSIEVTVPAGTEALTEDRRIRVATSVDLVIPAGQASGTVQARNVLEGDIGRVSIGSIGLLTDAIPGILTVTNTTALTGGINAETVEQGKIRAREEFRIGQHLGTSDDWETQIFFEELGRKGRVTAFEGYLGDFSQAANPLGHLLLVIQGSDGLAPTEQTIADISALINSRHIAGIQVVARAPEFVEFDLLVDVKVSAGVGQAALITKAKANLATLFDPLRFAYGPAETDRFLSLSDIVGAIEAAGPNQISVKTDQNRFAITITIDEVEYQSDVALTIGQLPLLGDVILNVVG
ncbi:MAG: baseplate J/gp47 family protein [Acidobacteriota bacterium]